MKRFLAIATLGTLLGSTALVRRTSAEPENKILTPASDMVQWKLDRFHKDPFKLIKSVPDPRTGQVRFLVEFTRRPELSETFDWEQRGGPVVFRFLDEDGVIMRTVKPRIEGQMVPEKGTRVRLILQMPDQETLDLTRSITVE
jgi:hypothetical protein